MLATVVFLLVGAGLRLQVRYLTNVEARAFFKLR
jgi:hypothetical protein